MPYEVIWEPPSGVVLRLTGVVTGHDFVTGVGVVHDDPRYDDLRYVIDDLSALEKFAVDSTTIEIVFANSVGAGMSNPNRRIYVVATDPEVLAQLNGIIDLYGDILPLSIHAAVEDARAALDKDLKDFQPAFPRGRLPR